jgi:hypothetical protein
MMARCACDSDLAIRVHQTKQAKVDRLDFSRKEPGKPGQPVA